MVKLLYAFLYQGQFLPVPGFKSHLFIWIGGFIIPFVNSFADSLTEFRQTDDNVNNSRNLYPGQSFCKHDQGHSIWHEVSANGLLDLIYFCDYYNQLVIEYVH